MAFSFEQGPIRPPSEHRSLLIRVTRNCPWNKCAFCHSYRNAQFALRSVEEVKQDIQAAGQIADEIRALSWKLGEGGHVNERIANAVWQQNERYNDHFRSIAAWLYYGGESVFLQDADSLILKTKDLVEILSCLRTTFPSVGRITSYCRSKTAARKSVEDFRLLRDAGLSRIHIGMESGYDPLLKFIRKGTTAAEHIEGGRRIVAAGISLSEYVIPGLGGTRWSREHAQETARVINQINPEFVRLRSLHIVRDTDLYDMMQNGEFTPLGEEAVLHEIRRFIECLEGIETTLVSDHILNLLEELEGTFPADKEKMLSLIDRYFALPLQDRIIFRLGRRKGLYRSLDDLDDRQTYLRLKQIVDEYVSKEPEQLDRDLRRLMHSYI
ncbi:MAG: radical SAM protein [Deltaproteobacteria bacterium HGW-Deltaproteobacteria-9]|nr:MAG: radical SAM protein [Deltaproteobacteria bacterium HGW-Deltaproteobacteria-9]